MDPLAPGPKKATLFQLVFLTYSVICSGAYGLEEMVSLSGPGLALLTLTALPFLWAVPVSLACAELSARYPVEGGYYRWTRMAFGEFTGYMTGWLVWLSTFTTNAAFAVLFSNYARHFYPGLSATAHFFLAASLVWVTVFLNYRGIRLVGNLSVLLTIIIFVPFLIMTVLGLLHFRFNPLVPFVNPDKGISGSFGASLAIAIWAYAGYEKLTTTAGEVEDPSRAFPIALAITVPLAAASYIIPTVVALGANGDWRAWGESHFSASAAEIGGASLGALMAAGGLVANACLLLTTLLAQSRLPMVLSQDGLFPKIFQKTHPRFGSPVASLLLGGLVLTALCPLKFSSLAGLYAIVQVSAYLLIYAALFKLRAREPGTGGFRIPLGTFGLALMTIPSVCLATLVIAQGLWHDGKPDLRQALVDLAVLISGPATYALFRRDPSPARAEKG